MSLFKNDEREMGEKPVHWIEKNESFSYWVIDDSTRRYDNLLWYSMHPFPDLRHRVRKRSYFHTVLTDFDLLIRCSNVTVILVEQAVLESCSS